MCTGSGCLAVGLAALGHFQVTACDLSGAALAVARENADKNGCKISFYQGDLFEALPPQEFDVIVSNPPYFVGSLKCPDVQRNAARHDTSLTYEELLKGVAGLLAEDGTFTVVIPADVTDRVKGRASMWNLYAVRQLNVITKPGGVPKRVLIAFSFGNRECVVEELLTEIARHKYSEEYIMLTREYYLKM